MTDFLYEISIFDYGIPLERYHADKANYNEIAKRLDQTYGRNWTTITIQRHKKSTKTQPVAKADIPKVDGT